jgi:elongator complex protein 2
MRPQLSRSIPRTNTAGKAGVRFACGFPAAETALRRLLAVGLESGAIHIFANDVAAPADWHVHTVLDSRCARAWPVSPPALLTILLSIAHVDHVYQLAWRPRMGIGAQLASCSEDGTLRILDIRA